MELEEVVDQADTTWDPDEILAGAKMMEELRTTIFEKAKKNSDTVQQKHKYDYDRKHSDPCVGLYIIVLLQPLNYK